VIQSLLNISHTVYLLIVVCVFGLAIAFLWLGVSAI
jgi:hypothetical protein